MRLLSNLAILAALVQASWATCNTIVQHKAVASVCSGNTCTVTVSSTGSGHILVATAMYASTGSITISSISAGGTFTHCSNCHSDDTNGNQVDMSYTLNSTSGVTSINIVLTGSPTAVYYGGIIEISCTGSPSLDSSGSTVHNTACTSCSGETLSLTGSSDGIVQIIMPNGTTSAVSGTYSSNKDLISGGNSGQAVAVSQSSGTAPNWTTTSGTAAVAAIAFKDATATKMMPFVASILNP